MPEPAFFPPLRKKKLPDRIRNPSPARSLYKTANTLWRRSCGGSHCCQGNWIRRERPEPSTAPEGKAVPVPRTVGDGR